MHNAKTLSLPLGAGVRHWHVEDAWNINAEGRIHRCECNTGNLDGPTRCRWCARKMTHPVTCSIIQSFPVGIGFPAELLRFGTPGSEVL